MSAEIEKFSVVHTWGGVGTFSIHEHPSHFHVTYVGWNIERNNNIISYEI